MTPFTLREYVEEDRSPFAEWFDGLDSTTAARIHSRLLRMANGNFGDSKPVGEGVSELRIDAGPGYRVYYARDGKTLVILLGGGSKKRQSRDIADALVRWRHYKTLKKEK